MGAWEKQRRADGNWKDVRVFDASNLEEWLEQSIPDVVCLQELKSPEERFPAAAIEKAGYGAIWHGQKRWNGVAILARGRQPEETRRGLPGDPDDLHSRYIDVYVYAIKQRTGDF